MAFAIAMSLPWLNALNEEVSAQEASQAADAAEIEHLKCETSDEEDSVPSTQPEAWWWTESLTNACSLVGLDFPDQHPVIKTVSSCTGCCAEGEIFKAWLAVGFCAFDVA